ncbi:MAG: hypothetical protein ACLGHQ_10080 [Acidimicrobiia bacterium]
MLHRSTLHTAAALAVVATLAACGGADTADDTDTGDTGTDTGNSETGDEAVAEGSSDDATGATIEIAEGDTVRDVLTGVMGDEGADLDAAISAIPPETRFTAVASQLEPEPDVEVNGTDIRLVFDGGSVSDATFACLVGGGFVEPGETLTMVYPDGEQAC